MSELKKIIYPSPDFDKILVGESERSLQDPFSYVRNKHLTKAEGCHNNLPGHTVSDMRVTIVEKIHTSDPLIRKQREELFIPKLNTKYKGLHKKWRIVLQVIFKKQINLGC